MQPFVIFIAALFGLLFGSFLNVVMARVPLDEPLTGRSRCPQCHTEIVWYDNIPLISWLILRAKCRSCALPIPARYPLVELLTAVLCGLMAAATADWRHAVLGIVFVLLLVPITFIDLDHRRIPNVLSLPGTVAGLVLGIALQPHRWLELLLASFLAGFSLFALAMIYPKGMGMGDVKMALMMGAFLGVAVPVGIMSGALLGLLPSIVMFARHGSKARKMYIPFGPFLAAGSLIAWFWGAQVMHWYIHHALHR